MTDHDKNIAEEIFGASAESGAGSGLRSIAVANLPPAPPLQGIPVGGDFDAGDGSGPRSIAVADSDETLPPDPPASGIDPELLHRLSLEPANDTGNGKRLLAHFGDDLLHVREIGWHEWHGTHWEAEGGEEFATKCAQRAAALIALEANYLAATDEEADAIDEGAKALRALNELFKKTSKEWTEADDDKEEILREKISRGTKAKDAIEKRQIGRRRFAVTSGNTTKIKGMLAQAIPHRTVTPDDLDSDPLAFNCLNGTLLFSRAPDPDAGEHGSGLIGAVELRAHDRADFMTKCAPVDYDPEATAPKWLAFIEKVQPEKACRAFLQTYHGYGMTGLTGEQVMTFNYGGGANGKSVFMEVLARITGSYTQTLSFDTIAAEGFGRRGDQATPDLVRLPGARLVRISEPKRGANLDEALIKSLTGGEPMLVRALHKGFFEFTPDFKMSLSGNHKPNITGGDHGIWRRVCLVPWSVTIPPEERRPFAEVVAELCDERAGILNWLVAGALRYLSAGLHIPDEVKAATEDYREESDIIANFIADCLIAEPGGRVFGSDMYEAYEAWCKAQPVRAFAPNNFGKSLVQKGIHKTRPSGRTVYHNVTLNPDRPVFERKTGERAPEPPHDDDPIPI